MLNHLRSYVGLRHSSLPTPSEKCPLYVPPDHLPLWFLCLLPTSTRFFDTKTNDLSQPLPEKNNPQAEVSAKYSLPLVRGSQRRSSCNLAPDW